MSGSYYTLDVKYNSLYQLITDYIASAGSGGASNIEQVLTVGDDAGGLSITDLNNVDLVTINGSAYPPPHVDPTSYTVVEDNTNNTFYPVFTNAAGATQTLSINGGTNPISVNPNTGDLIVDKTLSIQGNAAGARTNIGFGAGTSLQGSGSVAVGYIAGETSQGRDAVAIGNTAGNSGQADQAVAVGITAGVADQGLAAIAIGAEAGNGRQGSNSIAIGTRAGLDRQGRGCIAIGTDAGSVLQSDRSTVINSSGAPIAGNLGVGRTYIAPIRGAALGAGVGVLIYDPATFEVVYSTN
jgi:hypothetical protein|tara:strand:- start:2626 stop:3516 length:891 start_codon:yes stop_codon:yes gene_type:complete